MLANRMSSPGFGPRTFLAALATTWMGLPDGAARPRDPSASATAESANCRVREVPNATPVTRRGVPSDTATRDCRAGMAGPLT